MDFANLPLKTIDKLFVMCCIIAAIMIILYLISCTSWFHEFMYNYPENIRDYINWHITKAKKIIHKIWEAIKNVAVSAWKIHKK